MDRQPPKQPSAIPRPQRPTAWRQTGLQNDRHRGVTLSYVQQDLSGRRLLPRPLLRQPRRRMPPANLARRRRLVAADGRGEQPPRHRLLCTGRRPKPLPPPLVFARQGDQPLRPWYPRRRPCPVQPRKLYHNTITFLSKGGELK